MGKAIGRLISKSKLFYYSIKKINSPLLNQDIVFNRYGWKHLLYDSSDHRRNNKDIELRLFLLHDVREILTSTDYPIITSIKEPYIKSKTIYY